MGPLQHFASSFANLPCDCQLFLYGNLNLLQVTMDFDYQRSKRASSAPPSFSTSLSLSTPKISTGAGLQMISEDAESEDEGSMVTSGVHADTKLMVMSQDVRTSYGNTGDSPKTDAVASNSVHVSIEQTPIQSVIAFSYDNSTNSEHDKDDDSIAIKHNQEHNLTDNNNVEAKSVPQSTPAWKAFTTDHLRTVSRATRDHKLHPQEDDTRWAERGRAGSTAFVAPGSNVLFKESTVEFYENAGMYRSEASLNDNEQSELLKIHEDAKVIRDAAAAQKLDPEGTGVTIDDWLRLEDLAGNFAAYNLVELKSMRERGSLQTVLAYCAKTILANDLVELRRSVRAFSGLVSEMRNGRLDYDESKEGFRGEDLLLHDAIHLPYVENFEHIRWPSLVNPIHKLFRHENFHGLPEDVYATLKPALRLARKLLTHRPLAVYWHTLCFGERELDFETSLKRQDVAWRIVNEVPITADNEAKLTAYLEYLADFVNIGWHNPVDANSNPLGAYAVCGCVTEGAFAPRGSAYHTVTGQIPRRNAIRMHMDFHRLLLRYTTLRNPDPDALMRFNFLFAVTLLHELAHMVEFQFKSNSDRLLDPTLTQKSEVYFTDMAWNEVGHAWCKWVFGGSIEPIGHRIDAPHGLMFYDRGASEDKNFSGDTGYYSIPMQHVWKVQQQVFYEGQASLSDFRVNAAYSVRSEQSWVNDVIMWADEAQEREVRRCEVMALPGVDVNLSMPGVDVDWSMPGFNADLSMPGVNADLSMPRVDVDWSMPGVDAFDSMINYE